MIDTNQINQVGDNISAIKEQVTVNWTAICIAAAWAARELRAFNVWCKNILEWVIGHGGIGWLIWKLLWNPPALVIQPLGSPGAPLETNPNEPAKAGTTN